RADATVHHEAGSGRFERDVRAARRGGARRGERQREREAQRDQRLHPRRAGCQSGRPPAAGHGDGPHLAGAGPVADQDRRSSAIAVKPARPLFAAAASRSRILISRRLTPAFFGRSSTVGSISSLPMGKTVASLSLFRRTLIFVIRSYLPTSALREQAPFSTS